MARFSPFPLVLPRATPGRRSDSSLYDAQPRTILCASLSESLSEPDTLFWRPLQLDGPQLLFPRGWILPSTAAAVHRFGRDSPECEGCHAGLVPSSSSSGPSCMSFYPAAVSATA
ncbi:hypothetical protein [Sporisorium scitamineum]|uniref:Uncharacterized protein n=1 Tax=Sporisorium scitamineum TaxID=49012 RepID=A0A0F7S4T1_9BASI|nr:hypothetical protein [Sporisorium scitamineum]